MDKTIQCITCEDNDLIFLDNDTHCSLDGFYSNELVFRFDLNISTATELRDALNQWLDSQV